MSDWEFFIQSLRVSFKVLGAILLFILCTGAGASIGLLICKRLGLTK